MALFLTGAVKKPVVGTRSKPQCPFCKGPHFLTTCDAVKVPWQRLDLVRQKNPCFNCLGHHKVSSCNSKHRCHNSKQKHHTSLCDYEQQSTRDPLQPGNQNASITTSCPAPLTNTTQLVSTNPQPANSTQLLSNIPQPVNNTI